MTSGPRQQLKQCLEVQHSLQRCQSEKSALPVQHERKVASRFLGGTSRNISLLLFGVRGKQKQYGIYF